MFRALPFVTSKLKTPVYQTYRSPEAYDTYNKYLQLAGTGSTCALCEDTRIVVEEKGPIRVIKNDYPYAVFQGLPVEDHLMVVTRRHVSELSDLTYEEAAIYWRFCAEFSKRSYSLFTQAATKSQRSIPGHVHTHLIACRDL